MSTITEFPKIGSTVWVCTPEDYYRRSRRAYEPRAITGETPRKWVAGIDDFPKPTKTETLDAYEARLLAMRVYLSEVTVQAASADDAVIDQKYKIGDVVQRTGEAGKLRQVAGVVGYDLGTAARVFPTDALEQRRVVDNKHFGFVEHFESGPRGFRFTVWMTDFKAITAFATEIGSTNIELKPFIEPGVTSGTSLLEVTVLNPNRKESV